MGKLWRRLHFLLHRRSLERELAEEMEVHREMLPPEQQAAFGNLMRLREDSREIWTWTWLEQFWQDLSYGTRGLMRAPAFTTGHQAQRDLVSSMAVDQAKLTLFRRPFSPARSSSRNSAARSSARVRRRHFPDGGSHEPTYVGDVDEGIACDDHEIALVRKPEDGVVRGSAWKNFTQ